MSIPTTVEAVAVIAILFIPGYIFLQFAKSAVAFIPQSTDVRYFFALVTWGGLNHLIFFWWTRRVLDWYLEGNLDHHEGQVALWALVVLVVSPLLLGLAGSALLTMEWIDDLLAHIGMDYISRTPSAWNYATKLGQRWVRVHLTDGTIIGGTYGPGAFADDSDEKDIFLDQVYNLSTEGDFLDAVPNTAGVWIRHSEISHVMFYHRSGQELTADGDQTQHAAETSPEATT